jgi:hypothetical protein
VPEIVRNTPSGKSTRVLSLIQCFSSSELDIVLHSSLNGKGTLEGGFKDKEVQKFREAITVLGYQFWNQSI